MVSYLPLRRAVALVTLVATAGLILLGSTVRMTESGMGCRSWPLCNGAIGPVGGFHSLLEQSHRYLADRSCAPLGRRTGRSLAADAERGYEQQVHARTLRATSAGDHGHCQVGS